MKTEHESAYGAKLRQCNKEARITVGALAATIVVWAVCGFGLSGVDICVMGIPLWAVTGTVGTWVFAIIVAVVLARFFFADFDLDEDDEQGGER